MKSMIVRAIDAGSITAAVACLIMSQSPGRADSLFPTKMASKALTGSAAARSASLYSDSRAHEVGDILTVTIAENTSAQSSANTKTSHDDSVSAFGGTGLFDRLFRSLSLSATQSRAGTGTGQTTRSGSLVTTLGCRQGCASERHPSRRGFPPGGNQPRNAAGHLFRTRTAGGCRAGQHRVVHAHRLGRGPVRWQRDRRGYPAARYSLSHFQVSILS